MTQVSLKIGLNQFKEKGENTFSKELIQLHMNITFIPFKAGDLNDREKEEALELMMFLKEKRYGSVKGRAWYDGRK